MAHHDPVYFTYEAGVHCLDCTRERFGQDALERMLDGPSLTDSEGNEVYAVYSWEIEQDEYCEDCHEQIT